MRISDWSSDVCSSDLVHEGNQARGEEMTDEELVDALKALAHPVRLRIMRALTGAERNVGEIDEAAQVGQPTLSQQLAVLRNAGLVKTRKDAKLVYYRRSEEHTSELQSLMRISYAVFCLKTKKKNEVI